MQEQDRPTEKSWRCSISSEGMASGCHEGSETIEYDPVDNGAKVCSKIVVVIQRCSHEQCQSEHLGCGMECTNNKHMEVISINTRNDADQ